MGMWQDFKDAIKNDGPMISRMLHVQFSRATMGPGAKNAYGEIAPQIYKRQWPGSKNNLTETPAKEIIIPSHIKKRHAEAALKLLRLEDDRVADYTIIWSPPSGKGQNTPSP